MRPVLFKTSHRKPRKKRIEPLPQKDRERVPPPKKPRR